MKEKAFHITKREDKPTIGAKSMISFLQSLDIGEYAVTVNDWQEAKTYQQIKFFHGPVVETYMEYTGYSYDDAKYTLKKRYGCNKVVKDAQTGKQEVEIRSLRKYTKEQMSTFFERLLNHFEYDCGMVVDAETRKQFMINKETGELEEV